MNLVLADTEEFRRVKRKANKSAAPGAAGSSAAMVENEEKRTLGLTIVRGAHIISLSVESPPPADPSARLGASAPGGISTTLAAGAGIARPAGRGAPVGLAVCVNSYYGSIGHMLTVARALLLVLVVLHQASQAVSQAHLRLVEEVRDAYSVFEKCRALICYSTTPRVRRRFPTSRWTRWIWTGTTSRISSRRLCSSSKKIVESCS